jgi:hypothetical protein
MANMTDIHEILIGAALGTLTAAFVILIASYIFYRLTIARR